MRLFEGGWLHKNKNLPHVYRMFQIEAPESLIQPYMQYQCVTRPSFHLYLKRLSMVQCFRS